MTIIKPDQNTWNRYAKVSLILGLLSFSQIFCILFSINESMRAAADGPMVWAEISLCFLLILGVFAITAGVIAVTHYKECSKVGKLSIFAGLVFGSISIIYSLYFVL